MFLGYFCPSSCLLKTISDASNNSLYFLFSNNKSNKIWNEMYWSNRPESSSDLKHLKRILFDIHSNWNRIIILPLKLDPLYYVSRTSSLVRGQKCSFQTSEIYFVCCIASTFRRLARYPYRYPQCVSYSLNPP